ncbi:MAG: CARDB domain-containing protein [Pseudomonadota bacterium]
MGIRSYDDRNVISQLQLRCARVNRTTGNWVGSAAWTPRSPTDRIGGSSGLRSRTASCPRDQFLAPEIKGHLGRFILAEVVSGLRVRCIRYSDINRTTGRAVQRLGGERRIGARFSGEQQTIAGKSRYLGDTGIYELVVRYGHAVDSVRIRDTLLPWYVAPPSSRHPTLTGSVVSAGPSSGNTSTQPRSLADLQANMTSVLWRYSGTTEYRGRTYRRVPDAFCSTGMSRTRGSSASTKRFRLPALSFDVLNSGTRTARQSVAEIRFGSEVMTRNVRMLGAGSRVRQTVSRPPASRCVTSGVGVPQGCHECPGSTPYQDPALRITVDSTNVVAESNESNNRLQR